jgi:hypothetical protein
VMSQCKRDDFGYRFRVCRGSFGVVRNRALPHNRFMMLDEECDQRQESREGGCGS